MSCEFLLSSPAHRQPADALLSQLMGVFPFPFAIADIGWKMYMINGAWDALELVVIAWYWVETKGRTLEEIDVQLDWVEHSDTPDLEDAAYTEKVIRKGNNVFVCDEIEEAGK